MPKRVQPDAKKLLHEMMKAPTEADALKVRHGFEKLFGDKYPKATQCLVKSGPTAPPTETSVTATTRNFVADLIVHLQYADGPGLRPLAIRGMNIKTNLTGEVTTCKVGGGRR